MFVFAITQLSHPLIEHQDLQTLAHTVVLLLAVWWVWVFTTWVTNWLDPDTGPVRLMMFILMGLGMVLASALPEAFTGKAMFFAVTLVAMQVGRSLFAVIAFWGPRPDNALNFIRITIWLASTGALWIAGAVAGEARLAIWVVALLIDLVGPRMRFWVPGLGRSSIHTWNVSGRHMAERVSLFVIIVLGEAIVVTGTTFAQQPLTATNITAFAGAFVNTVLLWYLYFNHGERGGSDFIASSDQRRRGLIAQVAYTYIPALLVFGVLLTAVADGIVLVQPAGAGPHGDHGGQTDLWTAAIISGSSAIYLLGNMVFKRAVGQPWLLGHAAGIAALVVLVGFRSTMTPLVLGLVASVVLLGVVITDELTHRRLSATTSVTARADTDEATDP